MPCRFAALPILLVCLAVVTPAVSQESVSFTPDVVYVFGENSIDRVLGVITEETSRSVTIRSLDGQTHHFAAGEVLSIVRGDRPWDGAPGSSPPSTSSAPSTSTALSTSPSPYSSPKPSYLDESVHVGGRKEPAVSFILSFFVPGAGQFYNGDYSKGALQLGGVIGGVVLFTLSAPLQVSVYDVGGDTWNTTETGNTALAYSGLALASASALWSLVDAPMSASRKNHARGYARQPQEPGPVLSLAPISQAGEVSPGVVMDWNF